MKQVVNIKTIADEIILNELCSSYLYSSFYIFFNLKKCIPLEAKKSISIRCDSLIDLKNEIYKSLIRLLEVSYIEPEAKYIQKYPTRIEKIVLNEKVYKVDYRASEIGRVSYSIYCLINLLENAMLNQEDVLVEFMV